MAAPVRKVVVDADACPRGAFSVLKELHGEFGFDLVTVASFNHVIENEKHVVVGDAPDEADFAVVNRAGSGDIVVTQDLGLAAMALGKDSLVVTPMGRVIRDQDLTFMLEERHTKQKVRRGGGRTKGPRARREDDDARFEAVMRDLLTDRSGERV